MSNLSNLGLSVMTSTLPGFVKDGKSMHSVPQNFPVGVRLERLTNDARLVSEQDSNIVPNHQIRINQRYGICFRDRFSLQHASEGRRINIFPTLFKFALG